MTKLQELYNQKTELIAQGKAAIVANDEDLATEIKGKVEVLETEIKAELIFLEDEQNLALAQKSEAVLNANNGRNLKVVESMVFNDKKAENDADAKFETTEYYNAFVDDLMERATTEQSKLIAEVNNHGRGGSTDVVVPQTVVGGIWTAVEELYPLWAAIPKMRVNGKFIINKKVGGNSVIAWTPGREETKIKEFQFDNFTLDGHRVSIGIEVEFDLANMSRTDFLTFLQRELARELGYQLSYAVYIGTGDKMGYGVKTRLEERSPARVSEYDVLTYENLPHKLALLKSGHLRGARIYANNTTIWTVLATMVDQNKRPLFINNLTTDQIGTILGLSVVEAAEIPEGEILIGNFTTGMRANINRDIMIGNEFNNRNAVTAHFLHAIVDFDVLDDEAFVILKRTGVSGASAKAKAKD